MLTIIKTIIALCLTWLSQNTIVFYDNSVLYDEVFNKQYGTVIEKTLEGYSLENDYYLVEFTDGNIHEIESDDLQVNDSVTVWFWNNIPVRTMYDRR